MTFREGARQKHTLVSMCMCLLSRYICLLSAYTCLLRLYITREKPVTLCGSGRVNPHPTRLDKSQPDPTRYLDPTLTRVTYRQPAHPAYSSLKKKICIFSEILRSLTALKNSSFKICSFEFEIVQLLMISKYTLE